VAKRENSHVAKRAKVWVDTAAYAGRALTRGVLSIGAIAVGGLEAYAPQVIDFMTLPHDPAVVLFYGALAYLVPGLVRGRRGSETKDE
jgi:hypothetical protein